MGRRRLGAFRLALLSVPVLTLSCAWTLVLAERAAAPVPLALSPVAQTAGPETDQLTTPDLPQYLDPIVVASTRVRTAPAVRLSSSASAADIPDVALAAYQRAATVIDATDKSCHLPWQLLAAIGRVESNHGRFGGSVLDANGVASPAIVGVALTGGGGTTKVLDTDAGGLDGDPRFDRAVGPMQFIPSTWSYVGVDADGDGVRDPQDIDDSALASAVYLCAGPGDLATDAGQRHAVYRYNHSQSYVDLVLAIKTAYQRGDFWTVPTVSVVSADSPLAVRPADTTGSTTDAPVGPVAVAVHIPHPVASQVGGHHSPPPPDDPTDPGQGNGDPGNGDPGNGDPGPTDPPTDPPPGDGNQDPDEEPTPAPDPNQPPPADEPVAPEVQAGELCAGLGYVDDPAAAADDYDSCLVVALDVAPNAPLPTPEELLARLEEAGVAAPAAPPATPAP